MTDQPTPPDLPPEGEKKPIWTRWWMIVIYTVLALAILGSLIGGDEDGDPVAAGSTTTTQGEPIETTAAETTTTVAQTTTTVAQTTTSAPATTTTTQPTTTTTEAQTVQPDPVEFTGSGGEVIEFGDDLSWLTELFGIFEFEVDGSGNNAVWALDQDFETADLLVNHLGVRADHVF